MHSQLKETICKIIRDQMTIEKINKRYSTNPESFPYIGIGVRDISRLLVLHLDNFPQEVILAVLEELEAEEVVMVNKMNKYILFDS